MALNRAQLERAEHNERFLATIPVDQTPYLDWVVTVAFYVALRYIDASSPIDFESHRQRNWWVRASASARPIRGDYLRLYHRSQDARYKTIDFTRAEVNELVANMERIKTHVLANA